MSFSIDWENKIYSQNKQINKYPYGELVSIFFNTLQYLKEDNNKNIRILELGCGTGNNIKFLANLSYDTYGIDGSISACNIAKQFLKEENIEATIIQSDFQSLPFNDEFFDIIIDREAMYCGTLLDIKKSWQEANRVLKKDGVVISFSYTDEHKWCKEAKINSIAKKLEENTYTEFTKGDFVDSGIVHFTKYNELFDIFNFLDIKFINKHTSNTTFSNHAIDFDYSEWITVGVKK